MRLIVLTYNIWGIWLVAKERSRRVGHIAETLRSTDADVITVQECWVQEDADLLSSQAAAGGLPYSHYFRSGLWGPGLLTISRYPILDSGFVPYHVAGDPWYFTHGDWISQKGIGWIRIDTPKDPFLVFNTHTHANYENTRTRRLASMPQSGGRKMQELGHAAALPGQQPSSIEDVLVPQDMEAGHRTAHLFQLGHLVRQLTSPRDHIILAGDLNSHPGTLEYALLRTLLPAVEDAWAVVHPDDLGHTCNVRSNSWTKVDAPPPMRIDYVLTNLRPLEAVVVKQYTNRNVSFSDHFGLRVTLELATPLAERSASALPPYLAPPAARREVLEYSHTVMKHGASHVIARSRTLRTCALFMIAMGIAPIVLVGINRVHGIIGAFIVLIGTVSVGYGFFTMVFGYFANQTVANAMYGTLSDLYVVIQRGVDAMRDLDVD